MEHSEADPATQTTTSTATFGGQSAGTSTAPKQSQKSSPGSKVAGSSATASSQTPTGAMSGKGAGTTRLPVVPRPTRSVWSIHICPTTGGQFQLCASPEETIDGLKKAIAKKLKLTKERITLLNKERVLKEGSLRDNAIFEGCKLTLLPNIESGLMSQRPEHTVMQALENLSDIQVNDFLSGKSPLTLAMRLGDHMMFVQLQLSTSPPNSRRSGSSSKSMSTSQHSSLRSSPLLTPVASLSTPASPSASSSSPLTSPPLMTSSPLSLTPSSSPTSSSPSMSPVIVGLGSPGSTPPSSPAGCLPTPPSSPSSPVSPVTSLPFCSPTSGTTASHLGYSPFMLPPHITSLPHHHQPHPQSHTSQHHHHHHHTPASSSHFPGASHRRVASLPARTPSPSPCCSPVTSPESVGSTPPDSPPCTPPAVARTPCATTTTPTPVSTTAKPTASVTRDNVPLLDSSALAEASRNLSAKLKELSQASNVAKELKQTTQTSSKANGAIIESMQHHGQGIYSGTFSGTLNPALQDRDGKPKRSISTIVHILNDLLGATPQYRAQLAPRPSHPQVPAHHQRHHHHHLFQQGDKPHHHHHHLHHAQHRHQTSESLRSRAQGEHSRLSQESRRLSQENRATRGKMEQIQQMLEERRVRRRARREARATPYGRGWASSRTAPHDPASGDTTSDPKPIEQPMEVDVEAASNMADVQDKAGYGELTQETVVA